MAASKLVSKERRRRSREDAKRAVASDVQITTIDRERRALMAADAVLRCVAVALEYDGWTFDGPDYTEAIEVARNLISQSIERLESHSGSSTPGLVRSDSKSST